MGPVIVYPNNSVSQDGRTLDWTEADFERRGIPLVRRKSQSLLDKAERRIIEGELHLIFGTGPVADGSSHRQHRTVDGRLELLCVKGKSRGCDRWLPLDDFFDDSRKAFGKKTYCKECDTGLQKLSSDVRASMQRLGLTSKEVATGLRIKRKDVTDALLLKRPVILKSVAAWVRKKERKAA